MVTATDMGVPQLSSNLTILVEVQDMNDNPPVFEKSQYSLSVLESLPINTQVRYFAYLNITINFVLNYEKSSNHFYKFLV